MLRFWRSLGSWVTSAATAEIAHSAARRRGSGVRIFESPGLLYDSNHGVPGTCAVRAACQRMNGCGGMFVAVRKGGTIEPQTGCRGTCCSQEAPARYGLHDLLPLNLAGCAGTSGGWG